MCGGVQPLFYCIFTAFMNKEKIHVLLEEALALRNAARAEAGAADDLFEVDTILSPRNVIRVFVDAETGVTIDDCVPISRHIEGGLNREVEDFEIEVSSAGIDRPLKKPRQYRKNIGRRLKLTDREGQTWKGSIQSADESGITLHCDLPKAKKKAATAAAEPQPQDKVFSYEQIKEARIEIVF